MAGLGDPVVASKTQPAHPLGDGRRSGADDDPELRQSAAKALQPFPSWWPEHGKIDDQCAEAHRGDRVGRYGTGEHAMLPTQAVHALAKDLDEAAVAVKHRDTQRGRTPCARSDPFILGEDARRHLKRSVYALCARMARAQTIVTGSLQELCCCLRRPLDLDAPAGSRFGRRIRARGHINGCAAQFPSGFVWSENSRNSPVTTKATCSPTSTALS